MIKKIEEAGDIAEFEKGTLLTKYPLSGEFSEQISFEDNSNLLEYEIHAIDHEKELLELKIPAKNIPSIETNTVISDHPALIIKPFHELITDKIWWFEKD